MSHSIKSVIDIKKNNIKSIIHYLRFCENATKKQIASDLNLSFATVSNMGNSLVEHGIITEVDDNGLVGIGRSPKPVRLNKSAHYVAAADFHSSGVARVSLYNLCCEEVASVSLEYDCKLEVHSFIAQFADLYTRSFSPQQRGAVVGMCVAVSGIYDIETGNVVASELALFESQPLKDLLVEQLQIPIYIENESNLCAFCLAQKENCNDIIYFYLGEGLGIGIISEGRNVVGNRGYSAEICHAPLGKLEQPCRLCGSERCMQTDLSVYGFAQKYSGVMPETGDFSAWDLFLAALERGDAKAQAVARDNAQVLAAGVSVVVNLFDPEMVVLGGINRTLYDAMLPVIRDVNSRRCVVRGAPQPEYQLDDHGDSTVILGAAEMAYARWFPNF